MAVDGRARLGRTGEDLAAEHLARLGFRVLERNYRTRWGELDLVAFDGETLAFCEVKTRRARDRARAGGLASAAVGGAPLEAVTPRKQLRVRRMAASWLCSRGDRPWAETLRFDAIGILLDERGRLASLEHLEGVF